MANLPLPLGRVTTCDIYRLGRSPPQAPDVAGVAVHIQGRYRNIKPSIRYTHKAYFAFGVDIRDSDVMYVPNQNGTPFTVVKLARVRSIGGQEVKTVLLIRDTVPWPTQNV
jgi:hypothetical protein